MANKGRTAIVTGAGKRVGLEIARELLADGWAVVAHLHHDQDSVPDGAVKVVADLADPSCAEAIFAATAALPPARLLVNNAARFAWDCLDEFSADEFAVHMSVNVQAHYLLSASPGTTRQEGTRSSSICSIRSSLRRTPTTSAILCRRVRSPDSPSSRRARLRRRAYASTELLLA